MWPEQTRELHQRPVSTFMQLVHTEAVSYYNEPVRVG
jgi:hypothetical protein